MSKILFSLGIFLCALGLLGLAAVIYFGFQIRKHGKADDTYRIKTTFERLIIINYLCISLSALGFIVIFIGIFVS